MEAGQIPPPTSRETQRLCPPLQSPVEDLRAQVGLAGEGGEGGEGGASGPQRPDWFGETEGRASCKVSEEASEYTCKAAGHICPAVKEGDCP